MDWHRGVWIAAALVAIAGCEDPTAVRDRQLTVEPELALEAGQELAARITPDMDRYIVRFEESVGRYAQVRDEALEAYGGIMSYQIRALFGGKAFIGWFTPDQAERLRAHQGVRSVNKDSPAHPNASRSVSGTYEWGLDRVDQRLGESNLDDTYYYYGDGSGVHIYVIDSGVDSTHSEFTGPIGTGMDLSYTDSLGYHSCGAYGDNGNHGTGVASVAVGSTHGIATDATLHSVRITCTYGSYVSLLVEGFDWVLQNHSDPAIANLSYTGNDGDVRDAIDDLYDAGVLVTTGSGNDTISAYDDVKNRADGAFVIGATNVADEMSAFSNYGSLVDLLAPGSAVLTADTSGNSTPRWGTSFAGPAVAGVAALLLEEDSGLTPAEIRTIF